MIVPAVITIGIIYLAFVLVKRRKRMAEHKTLSMILDILVGWGVIFFGIYAIPQISDFWKLVIDGIDTGVFALVGIAYFQWQKRKSMPKAPMPEVIHDQGKKEGEVIHIILKKSEVWFWVFVMLEAVEVFLFFFMVVTGWVVYYVNGIAVVTFGNLILIGFAVLGSILFWDAWRRIREHFTKPA
jgi:hypothetical protein